MESDHRYYARRALEERRAAARAVTPQGKARREALAEMFQLRAMRCRSESRTSPLGEWQGRPEGLAQLAGPIAYEAAH